ncbi:hypothetical protein DVH05_028632 [Phytophthora capsici]|nr:hypothetical protein DVH05_028632 [Phytophthora capsici]
MTSTNNYAKKTKDSMKRRRQRLYEQRRQLMSETRRTEELNEARKQWAARTQVTTRVDSWWNVDGAEDEIEPASIHWSTNSSRWATLNGGQREMDDRGADGSLSLSTSSSTAPDGSWKTLSKRKSCNGIQSTCTGGEEMTMAAGDHTTPTKCEHPSRTTLSSCTTVEDPHDRLERKIDGCRTLETQPAGRRKASLLILPAREQGDSRTSNFGLRSESARTNGRTYGEEDRTSGQLDERTD